nr:MAG TPA: hypothetical protein [Bacteriophage sp.]
MPSGAFIDRLENSSRFSGDIFLIFRSAPTLTS